MQQKISHAEGAVFLILSLANNPPCFATLCGDCLLEIGLILKSRCVVFENYQFIYFFGFLSAINDVIEFL